MEDIKSTTARLRRTFHYPTDEDSADSQPDAMDEEEQEQLIQKLHEENEARNLQFRQILLALPLATTLPYLPSLFRATTFLLSLSSISSLLSTAFLLHKQPPEVTGIDLLDRWSHPKTPYHSPNHSTVALGSRQRRTSFSFTDHKSPLERYLPYLNMGLCLLLAVMGFVTHSDSGHRLPIIGLGCLPALVYAVTLVAKMVMGSVDPEKELGGLKYEYKGA